MAPQLPARHQQLGRFIPSSTASPLALSAAQPDASLLYGNDVSGRAYGLDLLIDKKPTGPWYGWIAASIGKSTRTDELTGAVSNYYLDTPFIFNAVANYQWRPRISMGARVTVRSVDFRQLDYILSKVGEPPILKQYDGFGVLPVLSYRITF